MAKQPIAEMFGFLIDNTSAEAQRYVKNKMCPFNNIVPSCTKDKKDNPLGVCTIFDRGSPVITCPIRFRQNWHIADHSATFFFPKGAKWTSLTEVRLTDKQGGPAGNIDLVLVSYDDDGQLLDFGSVEIQSVYISGNVRDPFEACLKSPKNFDWTGKPKYPGPDYLSSSRKRLLPQLIYKGGIINAWGKKQIVILQTSFFKTLPEMPTVQMDKADIGWFLYDLEKKNNVYNLVLKKQVFTKFEPALEKISKTEAGDIGEFKKVLQQKLNIVLKK